MQTIDDFRFHAEQLEARLAESELQRLAAENQLRAEQVESAQTQQQLENLLHEHAGLLSAAKSILGASDGDEICRNFITHMNSLVQADSTVLYLFEQESQQVIRSVFHRRPEAAGWLLDETQVSYAELMAGLSGYVIRTGEPVLSTDPEDGLEPPETLEKRRQAGSGALIVIPLMTPTGVIGTVTAHNRSGGRIFTAHDVDLLMTLAHQAAAAIHREQLADEIRHLATTDVLTGLSSRRECLRLAERELNHCQRLGQSSAVIMMDVDHFKMINDTYGHQIGDAVLMEVGALCRALRRPYDIIGRYGGEEFFGFFPDVDATVACKIAERVRKKVAGDSVNSDQGLVTFTLSSGVAVATRSDDSLERLIKRADQALYRSKHGGRNRFTLWREDLVVARKASES